MLSLRKPGLIEKVVNRGTAAVFKELEDLTAQARKTGRSGDRQAMLKKQRELKTAQSQA